MSQQDLPIAVSVLAALANLGILITIAFLAVQTRASTKAAEEARLLRIADIYRSLNTQYDAIIAELPTEINTKDPTSQQYTTDLATLKRYADQPGYTPGKAVRAIWRYYYMTRAEYELCRMGVLTDEIWSGWLAGIRGSFQYPAFREIWQEYYTQEHPNPPTAHVGYYTFMELARTDPQALMRECGTVRGLMAWSKRQAKALAHQSRASASGA